SHHGSPSLGPRATTALCCSPGEIGVDRLWEREHVVAAISATLSAARRGEHSTLLIIGEAGLGKTALLDHALSEAVGDLAVGFGRGEQMERALPFGVMHETLGSLAEGETIDELLALG